MLNKDLGSIDNFSFWGLVGSVDFKSHDKETTILEIENDKDVAIEVDKHCCTIRNSKIEVNNSSFIDIRINNSRLVIDKKGIHFNSEKMTKDQLEDIKVNITITLPKTQLKKVDISSPLLVKATDLGGNVTFDLSSNTKLELSNIDKVNIDASGQCEISAIDIPDIYIDCSGQSNIELKNISKLTTDLSGVSEIYVQNKDIIQKLVVDCSGISNFTINSKVDKCELDLSGLSKISFSDKPNHLELEKSGISEVTYL